MEDEIIKIFGVIFTITGIIILIKGFYIEGLLTLIVGELIDMPIRIAKRYEK